MRYFDRLFRFFNFNFASYYIIWKINKINFQRSVLKILSNKISKFNVLVIDDFVGFAIRCLSVDMKTGKSNKIIPSSSTLGKTKVLRKYNFDAFGSLISTNNCYRNNIFDFFPSLKARLAYEAAIKV